MNSYKVGDKVVIVKERADGMNSRGDMDHWLGKTMTIRALLDPSFCSSFGYKMEEDEEEKWGAGWDWYHNMIDHEATARLNRAKNIQVYDFMEEIEVRDSEDKRWVKGLFSHFSPNGVIYVIPYAEDIEAIANQEIGYACTPWKYHQKIKKTIWVNGVEVPAPETVAPEEGQPYYMPAPESMSFCLEYTWGGGKRCMTMLERGFVYLDPEDAVARAKAMVIYKEGDE